MLFLTQFIFKHLPSSLLIVFHEADGGRVLRLSHPDRQLFFFLLELLPSAPPFALILMDLP